MIAGLDLSINSTGVYMNDDTYILIVSKITKKQKENKNPKLKIIEYNKTDDINNNLYQITNIILRELKDKGVTKVSIEDVALGAIHSRSLIDLTGLNYWMRCLLKENNIDFITTPPTSWKKEMIGNGQATKDLIIDAWMRITGFDSDLKKVDDIADAYFLCKFLEKI